MKCCESSLFIIQDIMLGSTKGNICQFNPKKCKKDKKIANRQKIPNIANTKESLHN